MAQKKCCWYSDRWDNSKVYIASLASYLDGTNNLPRERIFNFLCDICVISAKRVRAFDDFKNKQKSVWSNVFWCVKRKIHYPIEWIQITEWLNYMNMNSCLHLSNKLKECGKFLWIRLWNRCFVSMKEFIFSKVAGCKSAN